MRNENDVCASSINTKLSSKDQERVWRPVAREWKDRENKATRRRVRKDECTAQGKKKTRGSRKRREYRREGRRDGREGNWGGQSSAIST